MEHNKIIPTKPLPNDKLKNEIEDFKFFVDTVVSSCLMIIKIGDICINPNVTSYSANIN